MKSKIWKMIPIGILLLFPLIKCNLGIDLADTGYSLGNFQYLDRLQDMWYLSTYLANLAGAGMTHLPFGSYMLGMRIYTGLLVSAMALVSYWFCQRKLGLPMWAAFAGNVMAIGLCWCPTVILYNYLTYFFLLLAIICLYIGLTEDKEKFLVCAGICLGCNIMVRLPNALEATFVLAVFYYAWLNHWGMVKVIRKTLLCVAGCMGSYGFWFLTIVFTKGLSAYLGMLQSLFGVSSSASGYSLKDMFFAMVNAYTSRGYYLKYLLLLVMLGFALFKVVELAKKKLSPNLSNGIGFCLYGMISIAILRKLIRNNLFQRNFDTDSSFIVLASVFLFFTIFMALYHMVVGEAKHRLMACLVLLQILVLPFGSNNNIYPVVNCLFLIAPVMVNWYTQGLRKKNAVAMVGMMLSGLLLYQSIGVGSHYIFGDGTKELLQAEVAGNKVLKGMKTSVQRATELEETIRILEEYDLTDAELLTYGDVPGLSYYLQMPCAIQSTWPDLESYSLETFREEMDTISEHLVANAGVSPVVIWGKHATSEQQRGFEKQNRLQEFMNQFSYCVICENDDYIVYGREKNK